MKNKKLTFNLNKSLWLFTISFLISIGLQAQNATWSLPPYYYDVPNGQPVLFPTQTGSSGIFPNYAGGVAGEADYTHAAMQDINGDILFFMVDGVIYDKDGYGMGELDGSHLYALGNFKGITEIIIVPVPENCEQYYIIGVFADNNPLNAGTTFKPFYAILDLSVPNTSSGRLGTLVNHSGSEQLTANLYDLTSGISPSWGGPKFKNCFIAASKLRSDNTRLLFASNGGRVWRYEISSTGIAFDNYSFSINGDPDAVDMRSEMELYEFSNGNYRIAVPHASGNPNTRVFISDLDNNGDLIPSTDHVLDFPSISGDHAYIKGMEFSPNGRYLYITHITNSLTFTSFPFKIYDVNTSSFITPVHSGLINDIPNFQHSTIELASDGKLYFANGSNLATIDNADNPLSLTWNNSQVSLSSYNYNSLGGSLSLNEAFSLYVIPDQVDDMDYTAHFTATPECCIIYTSFDVEADKNNQEYTGTATWSPGATNNPFGSVSGTVTVRDLLVIKNGANITINNMRFEFDVNARLIVENGARLTINNTTLTVYDGCDGNNLMWQGVEVWGIGTGTFQPAVSGRFIAQNNSIIEHAIEGAVNFKHATSANNGGIIQANTGTEFRNNFKDVVFNAFQSVFGSSQLNDQSYFSDVTFITDASLNNPSYNNGIIHATLNEVTGITFSGCDFENTDVLGTTYPYLGRGSGLVAYDAKFTVNARCLSLFMPCTGYDESNFTNLTGGIFASNATTRSQIADVSRSNFNNIWRSIYLNNMEPPKVILNDFNVGATLSYPLFMSYGLYLNNCSGYTIENNNLTTTYGGYVGVYVNNSGTAANEVYRNNFSNLIVGSQAASTNGDNIGNGVGLEFRCNTYEDIADYDILISSGMVADDHGNCLTVTGPSNNQFSYTTQYGDFWAATSSLGVPTYRYSPPNGYNLEPRNTYYNPINTATHECVNLPAFNPSNSCLDRQSGGGMMMMSTELSTQEAEYDSINNLMSTKDTSLLKVLEQDLAVVKSQMQRTRSYIMQELLLGDENSDGKLEAINFLQQHAAYNTNADEQALAQLLIATGNIGTAQSKIAQLQSKPNNQQFVEFSNIAITLKQHPKQSKALLKDSVVLQQVEALAAETEVCNGVASARALLVSLGLATYEEIIEVVIPTGSKARLANEEETKTTNKDSFVKVFPNPANDNLTISHNLETKNGTVSLEIMDIMGRVLLNTTINNTNNQIDINQLSSGLYFYNILQNDKAVQSGKLVVE